MPHLIQAQSLRFDKLTSITKLYCKPEEFDAVKREYETHLLSLANSMEFFEQVGLGNEAFRLYDKFNDVQIVIDESFKDDMSTVLPVVL